MTHYILGETRRRSMLGALAAVLGALGSIATAVSPAAAQNGALIQTQPLYGAPDGAAAYRILYRSTGLSGEPIVVSGMVVIPQGGLGRGDCAERAAAGRGPSGRRLGASDHRRRAALRPVARQGALPDDPGPA